MIRSLLLLALCSIAVVGNSQAIDMRRFDEFEAAQAKKRDAGKVSATKIDEEKFQAARDRREKRKEEAKKKRGQKNDNGTRLYPLSVAVPVPAFLRPFQVPNVTLPSVGSGRSKSVSFVPSAFQASVPRLLQLQTARPTRILFLTGEAPANSERKLLVLRESGFLVLAPELPRNGFSASVMIAEMAIEQFRPDLIVGDSRGGAVALNMNSADLPLLLTCPAWNTWGSASTIKSESTILHSMADTVVPFSDSQQLVSNSDLPARTIIETGNDHRLIDDASLQLLVRTCQLLVL
jgi:hypothetical protein